MEAATSGRRDATLSLGALIELTKPAVTRMVVITAGAGAIIAPGPVAWGRLASALGATWMVVSAANVLNMYLERDVDALMQRTRGRPIPSGRVAPGVALGLGVALALGGVTALTFLANPTAGLLAALALVSYVLAYTPLKRVTVFALHVGTLPGAMPPLIGWAAMTGEVTVAALSLFAIQVVWQIPHFLAIAIFRERDYGESGLVVYSTERGAAAAKRATLGYSLLAVPVGLTPIWFGLGGAAYAVVVLALGLAQVAVAARGFWTKDTHRWARTLFFATLPYLSIAYLVLALSAP